MTAWLSAKAAEAWTLQDAGALVKGLGFYFRNSARHACNQRVITVIAAFQAAGLQETITQPEWAGLMDCGPLGLSRNHAIETPCLLGLFA